MIHLYLGHIQAVVWSGRFGDDVVLPCVRHRYRKKRNRKLLRIFSNVELARNVRNYPGRPRKIHESLKKPARTSAGRESSLNNTPLASSPTSSPFPPILPLFLSPLPRQSPFPTLFLPSLPSPALSHSHLATPSLSLFTLAAPSLFMPYRVSDTSLGPFATGSRTSVAWLSRKHLA